MTNISAGSENVLASDKNIFITELSNHLKFTIAAVLIAIALIVITRFYLLSNYPKSVIVSQSLFDGFFVTHLFFASLTPAALLSIYRRTLWVGILLAIFTSAFTCTLSDIFFPYLGGSLLNYNMTFHLCIIEEPVLSASFITAGAFIGYFLSQYVRKLSRYTHSAHILFSSLAAGLYLISYGVNVIEAKALLFFPILIISVLLPCVLNDIGVPSFIVSLSAKSTDKKEELLDELHSEHHGHKHN
ncbi:MAG: hypothetical protein ACRDFC_09575 [Ignavibacteria bacterium]